MNEKLDAIKADLVEAKAKVVKVAADVARLHALIDGINGQPTEAEWAEVKGLSADLNTSLQAVDDQTQEEPVGPEE